MNRPSPPKASAAGDDPLAGLLQVLAGTRPGADVQLIRRAYDVAATYHHGQKRKSGDPYITHPLAVATILAETGADDQTLCAALLHDAVDDTTDNLAALGAEFGAEIASLIAGAVALDPATSGQMPTADTKRAMAAAMYGDARSVAIKLADRLHNLQTLHHLPRAKQLQKSKETLDVLVPLARRLGMDAITSQLQNLASATLKRHGNQARTASGRVLAATVVLLPADTRARWREEWLGELHVLPTRRERFTFAAQTLLAVARLSVTLRRPTAGGGRPYQL